MTWSRTVPVAAEDTFRDAADKVDISDLKPAYVDQFNAAVRTAENLIAVDEVPSTSDGSCSLYLSGWITDTTRAITVNVLGFKPA